MRRLTYLKNGRPCVLVNGTEVFGPVAERLHAYEETGYEPGEVHDLADRIGKLLLEKGQRNLEAAHAAFQKVAETSELAAAYNEDRLLILPVKVGGVLYAPWSDPQEGVDGIDEIPVEAVKIWTGEQDYDLEDVGRYIFTTREAAEASLKGGTADA